MKINTSELTGAALDWAVAKCEGDEFVAEPGVNGIGMEYEATRYSTNWSQGGPIIERESIRLTPDQGATYFDCVWFAGNASDDGDEFNGEGPTPLIAAMRCRVASKLGDEVEVPEELVS